MSTLRNVTSRRGRVLTLKPKKEMICGLVTHVRNPVLIKGHAGNITGHSTWVFIFITALFPIAMLAMTKRIV